MDKFDKLAAAVAVALNASVDDLRAANDKVLAILKQEWSKPKKPKPTHNPRMKTVNDVLRELELLKRHGHGECLIMTWDRDSDKGGYIEEIIVHDDDEAIIYTS